MDPCNPLILSSPGIINNNWRFPRFVLNTNGVRYSHGAVHWLRRGAFSAPSGFASNTWQHQQAHHWCDTTSFKSICQYKKVVFYLGSLRCIFFFSNLAWLIQQQHFLLFSSNLLGKRDVYHPPQISTTSEPPPKVLKLRFWPAWLWLGVCWGMT